MTSVPKHFVAFVITLLLLAGLAGCETVDPLLQEREPDLATRVRWVLPPNWTLEEQNQHLIISRKDPMRSHTCGCLDPSWHRHPEMLKQFVDETGSDLNYKIRLRLGPKVDLLEHALLTKSNSRIRLTRGTQISKREFYEAEAMLSHDPTYRQLPDYYDKDLSIYVESNLHPSECIYPREIAKECQSVLNSLDLLFSRYPGTRRLDAPSWLAEPIPNPLESQ